MFTRDQIAFGGRTALALCGYEPFGDCQSIRYRLDAARGEIKAIQKPLAFLRKHIPEDEMIGQWEHEIKVWEYVIVEGEKLLARELKK